MEKSIGYEIAFSYAKDETPKSLSAKVLYLTMIKSDEDFILDLKIDNSNSLILVTVTEEGINEIDISKLGKIAFKTELILYNISLKDDIDASIVDDIKEQNMYYFYNNTKEPYLRIIKNVYDGIDTISFD